jgi:UDP-N-acetylglucosamine:LPS N-acetylglucosamine transferase
LGILSRFNTDNQYDTEKPNKYLVVLSGPEPQRTMFEDIVLKQAKEINDNVLILRAKPESNDLVRDVSSNISVFNHVDDEMFVKLVNSSEHIICRGGYSSLMDLVRLDRTAYLVPTPGQTEQEYLAHHLGKEGYFNWCKQPDFQLDKVTTPNISLKEKYNDNENNIDIFIQNWIKNLD